MVVEGDWVTLLLGGVLFALTGYFFLRWDPLGQRARAQEKLPTARHPLWWQMDLYRPHVFIAIGAIMAAIGLIWGGLSLFM